MIAALALATLLAAPAEPGLEIALDPAEATVGDRVTVTLSLALPAGAGEPRFASWGERWGEAEVLEVGELEAQPVPGSTLYRQRLVIAAFKSGELVLPAPEVTVDGAPLPRAGAPATLKVRSVLPPDQQGLQPKPPAPPRPLPIPAATFWLLALLGGLLLAAAAWLASERGRQRAGGADEPELAPHPELLAALVALRGEASAERAHQLLSAAARRYLGRALRFRALESSTSEIQRELAGRRLEPLQVRRWVELLRACDQVKFARRPASADELTERAAEVRLLADGLEAHLAPPPPAVEERAA